MPNRSAQNSWKFLLPILLCAGLLFSCEEEVTDIGTSFLRDTVLTGSQTFGDLYTMSPLVKQSADLQGSMFNINYISPYLFCGIVPDESLEAWTVIKAPFLHDSLGTITNVELVLSMPFPFMYGAQTENIEFSVYLESKKLITEGTTTLTLSDLEPEPVGSFQGSVKKDSTLSIRIKLDSARLAPLLRTTGLSVVLVPNSSMKNIRAFSSADNGDDLDMPYFAVKFLKTSPDSTYTQAIYPSYDFHIVSDKSTDTTEQFSIRGAMSRRERITIDIKGIRSRLSLDPYSTINTALLQLHLASNTTSVIPIDTLKPVLVGIGAPGIQDSAEFLAAFATADGSLPNVYNFQMRELFEQAIRNNQDSLVVELRTGYALRTINSELIGVEDYHLNRWRFYNNTASDSSKRPRLSITYSYLR